MRLPLLLATLTCGLAQAAQVTVYKDQNFKGAQLALDAPVHDLTPANFHDQISSIVVHAGAWEVCTQPAFQGDCLVLPAGSYPSLPTRLNHRIESMREAPSYAMNPQASPPGAGAGSAIVLFSAPRFMGKAAELDRDAHAVLAPSFNGPPASMVVREGTWQLCTEPGYQGVCRIFRPGRYREMPIEPTPTMSLRRLRDVP